MRAAGTFVGAFALVLAVLLAAVGQIGRIDRQTLAVALAAATPAATAPAETRGRLESCG